MKEMAPVLRTPHWCWGKFKKRSFCLRNPIFRYRSRCKELRFQTRRYDPSISLQVIYAAILKRCRVEILDEDNSTDLDDPG